MTDLSPSCHLCGKPRSMIYAVQPDKPRPLCGACFGRWSPRKLDALLGVRQDDYGNEPETPITTAGAGGPQPPVPASSDPFPPSLGGPGASKAPAPASPRGAR